MGKLKHFLVLDFESMFDDTYSLRKMSTPEYILDPRFDVHLLAAYDATWDAPRIVNAEEIPDFLAQYPPEETLAVAHNMLFDGAILAWRYNWIPGRLACTLGMARALRTYSRYSLGAVAEQLFGHNSKGDVLPKVKGLTVQEIKNAGLWPQYRTYALQDAQLCANIYFTLAPEFPEEEAKIMDLVLRAGICPVLHANVPLLQAHLDELRRKKQRLLDDCGYSRASLMSTAQFKSTLEGLGVVVQEKLSATGRMVPQFARSDPFMQKLQEYQEADNEDVNYQVQTLAAARLSFKSTIEETRAERFLNIARLPWRYAFSEAPWCHPEDPEPHLLPVPLRYAGAHTHRLSGEWSMNMQNLPRDKAKSKLRAALCAPPGHKLITADLAQIEARIVAQFCEQDALVDAFRNGEDVYASFASIIFDQPVNKTDQPYHRFIGKTAILGLGYGCGADRFHAMVVAQARQYGIPLEGIFDQDMAQYAVNIYRSLFHKIKAMWGKLDIYLQRNINSEHEGWAVLEPVAFGTGTIKLPNAMTLRYQLRDDKLYGAKLLENITQALARIVIMQAAVRLAKRGYRMILQAHDELVFVVPDAGVAAAKDVILAEMVRAPEWMPGLPLAAELGVGDNYGSCK